MYYSNYFKFTWCSTKKKVNMGYNLIHDIPLIVISDGKKLYRHLKHFDAYCTCKHFFDTTLCEK